MAGYLTTRCRMVQTNLLARQCQRILWNFLLEKRYTEMLPFGTILIEPILVLKVLLEYLCLRMVWIVRKTLPMKCLRI